MTALAAFPITPADSGGRVDTVALRRLVTRMVVAKVDCIGLLGSTGGYPYLTRGERRRALEAALDETGGGCPIMVGVGALRTDEAVRLAQDARAAGAAAGLLAPMSYTPLSEEEVFEHFATVARESGLPLCVYDNPGTTHFTISPSFLGRLSRLSGVVAAKCPAPATGVSARVSELRDTVGPQFSLGFSGDWNAVDALLAGGDVWYSVMAGLFPANAKAIVDAINSGNPTEARRLNATLEPLWALFKELSSLRVTYAMADLLDLCRAEPPRPILPIGAEAMTRVAEMLTLLPLI